MSSKDEVRCQILRDGQTHFIFPNAVVLEMVRASNIESKENSPEWILGTLQWHGQTIPILSVSRILGGRHEPEGEKCVVIKTMGVCAGLDCYAIHTDSFPQFISIHRQGMLVDASTPSGVFGSSMSILVEEKSVLVLDLDEIEKKLEDWRKVE